MNRQFHFSRLLLPMVAGGLLLLAWTGVLTGMESGALAAVSAEVRETVSREGTARILILLRADANEDRSAGRAAIRRAQDELLQRFPPDTFDVHHRYQALPALAGRITAEGLRTLEGNDRVAAVQLDRPGGGHLGQSVPALEADRLAADYGLTGAGVTVAVLDSGVDTDHPDLADDLVAQHCFTDGNCPPYGEDEGSSAEDEQGHGTNVASIVTARGAVAGPGFAPDAEIIAVRVLDRFNRGWVSDWVAGLDWVAAHQPVLDVQIVNMSLGTWALYEGNCDTEEPLLAHAVSRLREQGITIFASSGNQGAAEALAAPACNSGVVAVGATYDSLLGREPNIPYDDYHDWFGANWPECYDAFTSLETITCFTNSSDMLDLLAPGARITGAGLNGESWTFVGTSQAAPTAAGIAALMLQANGQLAPDTIEAMLQESGRPVTDPRSGRRIPAVRARPALKPLLPVAPEGLILSGPDWVSSGMPAAFTAAVTPPSSTQPLLYHWQATGLPDVTRSGDLNDRATFTWAQPGTYSVTVTATNDAGEISETHSIVVAEVALTGVAVSGDEAVATGVPHRLQATALPPTASHPITYFWQAGGQLPQLNTGGATDEVFFTWEQPGEYTVTLKVSNRLKAITRTKLVSVNVVAPEDLILAGPGQGLTGVPYTITAVPLPSHLSQPLTYTWRSSEKPTQTVVGGSQATMIFAWETAGDKEIRVSVENVGGQVEGVLHLEIIAARHLYLPFTQK